MNLYYSPGACSIGIHLLLNEIGKPFGLKKLNFAEQEQYVAPFTDINPKSKVPTLERDDGSILTEFPAIALWLGQTNPGLLPADSEARARAIEAMDYVVATIHMQGFVRLFRPGRYARHEADYDWAKEQGRAVIDKAFALMDRRLGGKDYLLGDFSVADAALFYVEFWAAARLNMPLPPALAAHYDRMIARPAVAATLKAEGF